MITHVQTQPPIVIWRPAAGDIEPRQGDISNWSFGVLELDCVFFILLGEKHATGPAAETCGRNIGLHDVNGISHFGFVPFEFTNHAQGKFEGGIQVIVFVVVAASVEDTAQGLRSDPKFALDCMADHVEDTLFDQPLNLFVEGLEFHDMICGSEEGETVGLLIGHVRVEFTNVGEGVVGVLGGSVLDVGDDVEELLHLCLHSRTTRFYYGFVTKS
jgi:hypothetical protein